MLTQELVKSLFHYNPDTGNFTWRAPAGCRKANDIAGTHSSRGYIQVKIKGKKYSAHRLAWLYVYGEWPKFQIDHINGKRSDNRITNLRDVPRSINVQNQTVHHKNNSSKLLGVTFHKRKKKFCAQIVINGKKKSIGSYPTPEEAHQAYLFCKRKFHEGCTI